MYRKFIRKHAYFIFLLLFIIIFYGTLKFWINKTYCGTAINHQFAAFNIPFRIYVCESVNSCWLELRFADSDLKTSSSKWYKKGNCTIVRTGWRKKKEKLRDSLSRSLMGNRLSKEEVPRENAWRRGVKWKRTGNSCIAYSLAAACCSTVLQISRYLWYLDFRIFINILFTVVNLALFEETNILVWITLLIKNLHKLRELHFLSTVSR